jgi:transcriptional regulator with PAS, ATPase and Fis domain
MQNLFKSIQKIAASGSTTMIYGESGTGKELVAKAIHAESPRRDKPFVAINCGAIPKNLLESELFGHVKGAFTGATSAKPGKFEIADGGTLFLDEIGDMSPDLQVKLLRVLEEREFERVGGSQTLKVDVRIIAATHRHLEKAVADGNFRQDLFYRLEVIPLNLPALRQRTTDIKLLVSHFLTRLHKRLEHQVEGFSPNALKVLENYAWPGNVRELRNVIERLVVLKGQGIVEIDELPAKILNTAPSGTQAEVDLSDDGICLNTAVTEFEKDLILQSLQKANWVKNRAAKLLQLNRTTLVEKIKRHQLRPCSNM